MWKDFSLQQLEKVASSFEDVLKHLNNHNFGKATEIIQDKICLLELERTKLLFKGEKSG